MFVFLSRPDYSIQFITYVSQNLFVCNGLNCFKSGAVDKDGFTEKSG